ncbi:hypothetical protein Pcinc_025437 [Petrolisthes cinctipes]|uniref:Uncharacterized protein n=1 Tax=Petrolisthes cinctipes TaxID=88211 RepID=A0AAE1KBX9_PETCI|nr:hypothetical protein Pcinc_025437 [Petrolisthes cinctipes]
MGADPSVGGGGGKCQWYLAAHTPGALQEAGGRSRCNNHYNEAVGRSRGRESLMTPWTTVKLEAVQEEGEPFRRHRAVQGQAETMDNK